MLILSQDKETIINFENIIHVFVSAKSICCRMMNGTSANHLGQYKSEERAKEVLQEIIAAYKNEGIKKIDAIMIDEKIVYEMPEE